MTLQPIKKFVINDVKWLELDNDMFNCSDYKYLNNQQLNYNIVYQNEHLNISMSDNLFDIVNTTKKCKPIFIVYSQNKQYIGNILNLLLKQQIDLLDYEQIVI